MQEKSVHRNVSDIPAKVTDLKVTFKIHAKVLKEIRAKVTDPKISDSQAHKSQTKFANRSQLDFVTVDAVPDRENESDYKRFEQVQHSIIFCGKQPSLKDKLDKYYGDSAPTNSMVK